MSNPEEIRATRPMICGGDTPEHPFPVYLRGAVSRGFGRGSKELGCPTANLPTGVQSAEALEALERTGVYYGYAQVPEVDRGVYPMVMSVGWNPFYKNTERTIEVHVMHPYPNDFYGSEMRAVALGYIWPELNYVSREALIADIETDKQVGLNSLRRAAYEAYRENPFFS